jgi:DNA-binding transcriptional ArsR family regulator
MKDHEIVKAAKSRESGRQTRLAIGEFLAKNPGWHKPGQVSEGIGMHYTTAANYLLELAEEGLIQRKDEGNRHFYAALDTPGTEVTVAQPVEVVPIKRRQRRDDAKTIEFVINGMAITVGRSARGGIRVEFEED